MTRPTCRPPGSSGKAGLRPATAVELDLLTGLVGIPSPSGQEEQAARWLRSVMTELGIQAYQDDAGNVIGKVGSDGDANPADAIYLLGHIDTVAGYWRPTLEQGRLSGRGASDAKGPMAAFIAATVRARDSGRLSRPVLILGAVEEERSSAGARHLATTLPPPAFLVVGEPSGCDRVVVGYLGRLRFRLEVSRPASHSSAPAATASELAIEGWMAMRGLVDELNSGRTGFDSIHLRLLGFQSATDGLTDRAELTVGLRLPPTSPPTETMNQLQSRIAGRSWYFDAAEPAVVLPRTGRLPAAFARAIRDSGMRPGWQRRLATSDLNVVWPSWRCPAVVYGPGDSELDHTPAESISVEDYGRAISVLAQVLTEL
ncbi:MAG TPA: M20/M25/M40 family metallo-hydrolase [Candidatus Dormibacteraeota bacterium]|nr:M20/M25/M40 family metallo-hydrolase [Candidatus Dormibacteraeota bacterium]